MRIQKITITNYRSCIKTTFEPNEHLSTLIGPNGTGKTNVLSAIRLLPALCTTRGRSSMHRERETSLSEIKTYYEIRGKRIVHTATLNIVNNEKNQDEIINARESWYMPDLTGKRTKLYIPSWIIFDYSRDESEPLRSVRATGVGDFLKMNGVKPRDVGLLTSLVTGVSKISYYSASQFTNPGSCPISFEVEADSGRRTGISISGHKKFLYDLYQAYQAKSESYNQFLDLVGRDGVGLIEGVSFNEITTSSSSVRVMAGGKVVKRERKNLLVIPSFKVAGNSLSPSQLSEGTFKTLALIFYLVTDTAPIVMIEEPEVCVHHGLLSSIVELVKIYSGTKQILVSTHADSVLDQMAVENVFRVSRTTKTGTVVSSISKSMKAKELAALKTYLDNEGSLGEYWKHGDLEDV